MVASRNVTILFFRLLNLKNRRRAFFVSFTSLLSTSCAILTSRPETFSANERLQAFPVKDIPLRAPAQIRWNSHQVPYIQTANDEDLALLLGAVHVFMRWGQLELLRHISQGRSAELAGPFTAGLDHTIRTLRLNRAAPEIIKQWDPVTRAWCENYLNGMNWMIAQHQSTETTERRLPYELTSLGIPVKTWAMEELVTVWRLAAADVNWFSYFSNLMIEDRSTADQLWREQMNFEKNTTSASVMPARSTDQKAQIIFDLLQNLPIKSGSNSWIIGPQNTKNRAPIMANDPHLGILLPNPWFLVGLRSPGIHSVGLTIPGLPFVAVGRNPRLTWGGTNMRALSSFVFELSEEDLKTATTRKERIQVKGWFDRDIEIRETSWGPVLSDVDMFSKSGKKFAFYWMGYEPSDEVGSFLKAMKSKTIQDFRNAFENYSVSAQNLLVTDRKGEMAQVLAYRWPQIPYPTEGALLASKPKSMPPQWLKPTQLPLIKAPKSGYLASANNRPIATPTPMGLFFSHNDRIERIQRLLETSNQWTVSSVQTMQLDTVISSHRDLAQELAQWVSPFEKFGMPLEDGSQLKDWDGNYSAGARAPFLFQAFCFEIVNQMLKSSEQSDEQRDRFFRNEAWADTLRLQLSQMNADSRAELLQKALKPARSHFQKFKTWGEIHPIRAAHYFSNLPVWSSRFVFQEFPSDGHTNSILKSASQVSPRPSPVFYGANARHISDLSDPNQNYFVLFGAQDGWLGSDKFTDQVDVFRQGKFLQVPMESQAVEQVFTTVTSLRPEH